MKESEKKERKIFHKITKKYLDRTKIVRNFALEIGRLAQLV